MTPRILSLPLLATALVAVIGLSGVCQSASATPAPLDASGTIGDQGGGHLTITAITSADYENSDAYLSGQCVTQEGLTLCHQLTFDNVVDGEAVWTAVAAVGHADDVYVDAEVKTVENAKLDSTGHASGLGPWIKITWVRPTHLGDNDGITIPGEDRLQLLTELTVPGVAGATAYCAGPEQDLAYSLGCSTEVPAGW